MQRLRNHALAGAVLARQEDVRVGGADARNHLEDGAHGGGLSNEIGPALAAEQLILLLEAVVGPDGGAQLDLVADDGN